MTQTAIYTNGLSKRFGKFWALSELHLDVAVGEVFGFLGPNGAGKSTTIRTLLDQIRPTAGTAQVLGLDAHRESLQIRRRIGYVPGDLAFYTELTGGQLIHYFARLRRGVESRRISDLADRFHLDLGKKIKNYSSGNRQKVGLIQAFMHQPELLILDEPNAGLDPLMQQELLRLIGEVRTAGGTVFLSSHSLSEVEQVADRVAILCNGKLIVVERIDVLRQRAVRKLDIEFSSSIGAAKFTAIPGVREISVDGHRLHVSYEGAVTQLLRAIAQEEVLSISSRESHLEEIFLSYYQDDAEAEGQASARTAGSPDTPDPVAQGPALAGVAPMSVEVFTLELRRRWWQPIALGLTTGGVGILVIGLTAGMGEAVAKFTEQMPSEVLAFIGGAGAGGYAIQELFNLIAPAIMVGYAVTVGASSIGAEEEAGTMSLLSAQPLSRSAIVTGKLAGLVCALTLGTVIMWCLVVSGTRMYGLDIGITGLTAVVIHLLMLAIMFAVLSVALSAATGRTGFAAGVAGSLAVAEYFGNAILPLANLDAWQKVNPWYYFAGSNPLDHGVDIAHLALLLGLTVVLSAVAYFSFAHRDLRG